MRIWFQKITKEKLNSISDETLVSHCGIKFTKILENSLEAEMPFLKTLTQPAGILHGGANCVLAETLGSVAANCVIDQSSKYAVGQSIHTSHLRPVSEGTITGIANPIHLGSKTHLWEIKTFDSQGKLTSDSKLTMAILDKTSNQTSHRD